MSNEISFLKGYLFKAALEILTGRMTNFDNFLYWSNFGFENYWHSDFKQPSLEEMKIAAEKLIYYQFEEICERIYNLESKTSEDRDY